MSMCTKQYNGPPRLTRLLVGRHCDYLAVTTLRLYAASGKALM